MGVCFASDEFRSFGFDPRLLDHFRSLHDFAPDHRRERVARHSFLSLFMQLKLRANSRDQCAIMMVEVHAKYRGMQR